MATKTEVITAASVNAVSTPEAMPSTPFITTVENESRWNLNNVPAQSPKFTVVPGEKRLPAKIAAQKIALAEGLMTRWREVVSREATKRPTVAESGQAVS